MARAIPVSIVRCDSYRNPSLFNIVGEVLDKAELPIGAQSKVLVKPNLLAANKLACTSPEIVCSVCKWLLDKGCKIEIGDSPGFGSAENIAQKIGLADVLKPFGLKIQGFKKSRKCKININSRTIPLKIAVQALECDNIFSVFRVKAHSQLRMTLGVKNCFGVIPGLEKAFLHSRYGENTEFFAALIIKIMETLPPVTAIADGITAMQKTGPSNGIAFQLNLVGACENTPLMDYAILKILKIQPETVPIANLLCKKSESQYQKALWPLDAPASFNPQNFEVPAKLKSASFNPLRLLRSCLKRIWKNFYS